ncbi:MAG: helix-turn-helix domain-containing protein [Gemmatimonas sp.]|nr:helix-turn-helix domain-containing protein [Gemmatimonas sp.]
MLLRDFHTTERGAPPLTTDDVLFRFRLRALALAEELGSVRAACRVIGIHPSTFYRWRGLALRFGLEMLRPRERRQPRMANATPPFMEHRWSPSCSGSRASARRASRRSWRGRSGAASNCRRTGSGACGGATA